MCASSQLIVFAPRQLDVSLFVIGHSAIWSDPKSCVGSTNHPMTERRYGVARKIP